VSEVQKMREQYGCPLDDATAANITKYLQGQYSAAPTPGIAPLPLPRIHTDYPFSVPNADSVKKT
jgi:hypothetical protein